MNRRMKERHGRIRDLSFENSGLSLLGKTMAHVMTRPGCLIIWWISWRHLCSLCLYGRLRRNVPVLALCLLWWICALIYGIRLWRRYNCEKCPILLRPLLLPGNGLKFTGTDESGAEKKVVIAEALVKWYVKRKNYCQLFLRNKTVLTLDLRESGTEDRDFLDLKLSVAGITGKKMWRISAGFFLCAVMLYGSFRVAESAVPYRGKLAWYLQELKDVRKVTLRHDNVYESGVEGVLEDIREKVDLPETLCLATSFNLHFLPDGRIQTLDTMLYGFDEEGNFVDSYLIGYNAAHSEKIRIYLHGTTEASYRPEKDLAPLVEAVSNIPLEETVAEYPGEECYGILYYGVREWSSPEGIRFPDCSGYGGAGGEGIISGYSVSVFCPENEEAAPVRYLY